jgi:RNA polymerase sigma-70 factor (ECF subfamily)
MSTHQEAFLTYRPRMYGIAYRMLGSKADAEDVVQDAWLRWHEQQHEQIRSAEAWLTTAVTRLAIDRLRALKAKRETYVGPWLPEPLAEIAPYTPESHAEFASDLSIAFLTLLERLTPEERAAFVLRDAFDCDYDDIAETIGKTPAACRQLVHRARERIGTERRRFRVDEETKAGMLRKFIEAANSGDFAALKALFAPDARMVSDGGGKAVAIRRVLYGQERLARLWWAVARRRVKGERRIVRINGELGIATWWNGQLHSVSTIDTDGERIFSYYSVANPEKLSAFRTELPRAS